ncbi:MAG: RHS repeat-associated core domain-containing protein [Clostridiales bacterium]|nr:RHS repeat-associated core domain-containing protein [Clostridiales bacterium]
MLSDGTWTYTWEQGRQLKTMTNGTTTLSFGYNEDGLRTSKTVGNTTWQYVYNGSNLVYMTDGTNTLYFIGSAAVIYNGTTYYYVKNLQGDIVAIADTTGNIVVEYTYDAWGNILTTTGTMATTLGQANPLRYRGYYYDTETELYYLKTRYYSPKIGRFINADVYIDTGVGFSGSNMFAYCGNSPVIFTDSNGMYIDEDSKSGCISPIYYDLYDYDYDKYMDYVFLSERDAVEFFYQNAYGKSMDLRIEFGCTIVKKDGLYSVYALHTDYRNHSVSLSVRGPEGYSVEAYCHTHPNSPNFSDKDKSFVINNQTKLYMLNKFDGILKSLNYEKRNESYLVHEYYIGFIKPDIYGRHYDRFRGYYIK